MNYIKAGQLYKHTPTGIVRRVVLADNNRVTFKEDATSYYSHCSIKDFKKYWRPYEVPNGKPTNLTERQWLQVRTKAFKDWFGDWINAVKANMISLGKEIPNTDKYSKYGQKGETDIEIREVLDENGNVIGTVRMEFSGKNRNGVVTLHPQLSVTRKGYGTALYQHIADTYGIPVEESFGEIGKSEAGKALWNKLQRDNNTQISKGDIPLRQLLPTNASKLKLK